MAQVKKVIKLINGEIIFGNMEGVETPNGTEILVVKPYQAIGGNIMPYCMQDLGNAPGAVQIHPMNVLWSSPLEDFPEVETAYIKATTGLEVDSKPSLVF